MKLYRTILDVNSIVPLNYKDIITLCSNQYYWNEDLIRIDAFDGMLEINNKLFIKRNRELIELGRHEEKKILSFPTRTISFCGKGFIGMNKSGEIRTWYLFDANLNTINEIKTSGIIKCYSDFFLETDSFDVKIIKKRISPSFIEQWSFQIPPSFTGIGNMSRIEDAIYVRTREFTLICLDLNTGQQLWHQEEPLFNHWHIIPESNRIIGIGGTDIVELNPSTGEIIQDVSVIGLVENKTSVTSHLTTLYKGYFLYGTTQSGKYKWGIVEIDTARLLHEEIMDDYEHRVDIGAPIYHQGKIYVRRSDGLLFVYESCLDLD